MQSSSNYLSPLVPDSVNRTLNIFVKFPDLRRLLLLAVGLCYQADIKLVVSRSQLEAFRVSNDTDEFWNSLFVDDQKYIPGKRVALFPTPYGSNYWKGSPHITLDYCCPLHTYIYIYIYIYMYIYTRIIKYVSRRFQIWICTRLQRVIAVENSTACEEHESTRRAGAKNVILLPENVNWLMDLWVRFTPTVFTSPLLTISVLETFFASQEFSGPRVLR